MVNDRLERGSKLLGRKLTYGNPDSHHHSGLLMDAGFEDVAGELALRADMILQAQADGCSVVAIAQACGRQPPRSCAITGVWVSSCCAGI